jgi:hypothetical protein
VPTKNPPSAAGCALRCPIDILIEPRETESISLGLGLQLPHGCVGLIAPCSDWSLWEGLKVIQDTTSCTNLTVTLKNIYNKHNLLQMLHMSPPNQPPPANRGVASLISRKRTSSIVDRMISRSITGIPFGLDVHSHYRCQTILL